MTGGGNDVKLCADISGKAKDRVLLDRQRPCTTIESTKTQRFQNTLVDLLNYNSSSSSVLIVQEVLQLDLFELLRFIAAT